MDKQSKLVFGLLFTAYATCSATVLANESEISLYTVTDSNVLDEHSYQGYIIHRTFCARCHANYAQGMIGPDLSESMKVLTREAFDATVANGRNAMPPWKNTAQVNE